MHKKLHKLKHSEKSEIFNSIYYLSIFLFLYCSPHKNIESSIGFKLSPVSVREYSTLGGISAYAFLLTSPSSSISRSCCVRIFWLMEPMDFFNSPKRLVPSIKSLSISIFHLSPMMNRVVSTGQSGNSFTWKTQKQQLQIFQEIPHWNIPFSKKTHCLCKGSEFVNL